MPYTAPPVKTAISDQHPNPSNATARAAVGQLWEYVVGLLGNTGQPNAARDLLQVGLSERVKGLKGNPNATTPLTKFDLSADEVVLRNADNGTVVRRNTGNLTVDFGLSSGAGNGAIANGRAQLTPFSASSWIHIYFIFNPTTSTLALIAADHVMGGPHTAAPTLPSGYAYWCYATTLRWNASSNIVPVFVRGAWVLYDVDTTTVTRALASGTATAFTAVSCASFAPPVALSQKTNFLLSFGNGAAGSIRAYVRTTGSSSAGAPVLSCALQVVGQLAEANSVVDLALNSAQSFDYKLSGAPTSGGLFIDVGGYKVPNGDA